MRQVLARAACVLVVGGGLLAGAPGGRAQMPENVAGLEPGLAVCYINQFIRHVDEMAEWEKYKDCESGAPLAMLDSRAGQGPVLTSGSDDGVMAKITGYIRLDRPGFYGFAFESNDGVRLEIDGVLIVEDPGVHADQFSDIGGMEVTKPGWYPLVIRYFERKNTSTLRFFWAPPGVEGTMPLVPAEALAH
jgi:hypothetical protein